MKAAITRAAGEPLCKGFAVGRTIFGPAAEGWFAGTLTNSEARAMMAGAYAELRAAWTR